MFLIDVLKRHWLIVVLLLIVSVGAAVLEGAGITLILPLLEGITERANSNLPFPFNKVSIFFVDMPISQRFQIVAILLFLLTVIRCTCIYLTIIFSGKLQMLAIKHSRMACVNQIMKVGMNYFNKQKGSDFQLIIDGYTDASAGAIVNLAGTALPMLFTTILLFIFLLLLSWQLTLISAFLVGLATFFLNYFSHKVTKAGEDVLRTRSYFNKILFDIINGMKLVRLFNREKYMMDEFGAKVDQYNSAKYKATKLVESISPLFEVVGIGILALILFFGSFIIPKEEGVWLGILLTFIIILVRLIPPIKTLNHVKASVIEKLPAVKEVNRFLSSADKEYIKQGTKQFKGLQRCIEFQDVEFGYNPKDVIVLHRISFVIPKGIKIGIVGPSGGGKSTITELLLRFYDPQKGKILIDGTDLRDLDLWSWRKHIGVVSQDTFLFNDSVKKNIAFAMLEATQEKIEQAAHRAHAHEFIKDLPNGYETIIGDRGVLLSGGQRQRIAIARAILAEPEILVFDEATSNLDTESERTVQQALDEIGKGKTVITIAHRLSTVFDSDKIIVIEDGHVIEQGKHQELLSEGKLYRKLVELQSFET